MGSHEFKQCSKHGISKHRREKFGNRLRCLKCAARFRRNGRIRTKLQLLSALGTCCNRCGYDRSLWALEFHHKDRAHKLLEFSKSLGTASRARLLQEAKKCEVLCANCHAEAEESVFNSGDCGVGN